MALLIAVLLAVAGLQTAQPGTAVIEGIITYFPGTLDAPTAAAVHLRAGDEANADFSLLSGRAYSIAGTVTNSDLSKVASVRLHAIPQDPRIPLDSAVTAGVFVSGDFQLRGLLPGIYDLFAVSFPTHMTNWVVEMREGEIARLTELPTVSFPMRVAKASVEIRDEIRTTTADASVNVKVSVGVTPYTSPGGSARSSPTSR